MARKPKEVNMEPPIDDTAGDLFEGERPEPALTFRARVLYERLLRVMNLPEGYPERDTAIRKHTDALTKDGYNVPESRGAVEYLLRGEY